LQILLMGNPNVGKSVFFSRLTGTKVIASNYPGTTVGFTRGHIKIGDEEIEVIDVPGTYTLEPTSAAEEVALQMLQDGDVVIDVLDSTNLERNLYLTQELLERDTPVVVALNMWDDTKHRGISIDAARLEQLLGVPVVPTVAVTGEGIKGLLDRIPQAVAPKCPKRTPDERWAAVGSIISEVQTITHHHHTRLERLQDASVKPITGLIIAFSVLAISFFMVWGIGETLIRFIMEPVFGNIWEPLMMKLSTALGSGSFWHDILIGQMFDGNIDFVQSMGVLTTGLFIPLGVVLPYVLVFYFALGLLEDTGYLPRLAVLLDNLMHRIGLHGFAIIPTMLGLGCCVPAILSTRILESKRQRFIAATLISIAIPCAASQAMIIGLVGAEGWQYVALVYGTLILVWITLGLILSHTVKGYSPELLIEIPPYRLPPWRMVFTKLWIRIYAFLKEALPIIMGAIFIVSLLYTAGVFDAIANFTAPVVSGIFGLPEEAVVAIVVGFLRKDIAIGLLSPLSLTAGQLVVGCVVLTMFFPCIAAFVVLAKELRFKGLLAAIGVMIIATIVVGGLLNVILLRGAGL
jgi:ferrous iron transport protein B